jgi:hypothetical protein
MNIEPLFLGGGGNGYYLPGLLMKNNPDGLEIFLRNKERLKAFSTS